jgi:hypothetical protein
VHKATAGRCGLRQAASVVLGRQFRRLGEWVRHAAKLIETSYHHHGIMTES